ncbi:copper resistance protein CopC, partial [Streptomyces coeruleorubidus]|uniref:copper resistance CopC family protein n=1 Tax=Streptomyces coeruleorubidus TaxID=116188 RepID=UPI0036FAAEDD
MSQTIAPRVRTLLLLLLAVTGALLAGSAPVSAHAALTASDPQQGSVVKEAPAQVSLTFSEGVAMSDGSVRVLDPKGKRVDTGKTGEQGTNTYSVKLHSGLPDGTFTVTYQVVSADSHPISGAFTFSIGKPSETTASVSAEPAVNPASGALYDIARYAAYAAVALLIGAATFVLVCRPASAEPLRGLVRAGWWVLVASTAALLLFRGPYERGTGPSTLLDPELIENTLTSRPGWALLARLALLAGAAVFLVRLGRGAAAGTG